jgi:hypothetical protein
MKNIKSYLIFTNESNRFQLDQILDKISKDGIDSLSQEEKKFLDNYDPHINRNPSFKDYDDSDRKASTENGNSLSDLTNELGGLLGSKLLNQFKAENQLRINEQDLFYIMDDETLMNLLNVEIVPKYDKLNRQSSIVFNSFYNDMSKLFSDRLKSQLEKNIRDIDFNNFDPDKESDRLRSDIKFDKNDDSIGTIAKKYAISVDSIFNLLSSDIWL